MPDQTDRRQGWEVAEDRRVRRHSRTLKKAKGKRKSMPYLNQTWVEREGGGEKGGLRVKPAVDDRKFIMSQEVEEKNRKRRRPNRSFRSTEELEPWTA